MPLQSQQTGVTFPADLYAEYGLSVDTYFPMQTGYRNHNYPARLNNGATVNLIVYKSEDGIAETVRASHYVAEYLAVQGFIARRLYDTRILKLASIQQQRVAAVYVYLPGQTISWEAYTREHIKNLGAAMGTMHSLLVAQPRGRLPLASERFTQLARRMQSYFSNAGVRRAMRRALGVTPPPSAAWQLYMSLFARLDTEISQPLHLDFVRGNILFQPGTASVAGVLDFEKVAYGTVLYDAARTLAFLLVDCKYKPAEKVWKYFLQSGYTKRGAASLPNLTFTVHGNVLPVLPLLTDFFLLHDFYKFLRHNPYDALVTNEHYVRTRGLLTEQKLLHYSLAD